MRILGGLEPARIIHRISALLTLLYALIHLIDLGRCYARDLKAGARPSIFGPDSLLPRVKDFKDFFNQWRWFFGLGERPRFGRWSYMEKFDYWAVFWGVIAIGSSGLVLWFPMFFTGFLPGWIINLAKIVHSEEAMLAVGYIFAIHFFNVHLRPSRFPIDTAIFTGRVSIEELACERPAEYERMIKEGALDVARVSPVAASAEMLARIFGFAAVAVGVGILALTLVGVLTF